MTLLTTTRIIGAKQLNISIVNNLTTLMSLYQDDSNEQKEIKDFINKLDNHMTKYGSSITQKSFTKTNHD